MLCPVLGWDKTEHIFLRMPSLKKFAAARALSGACGVPSWPCRGGASASAGQADAWRREGVTRLGQSGSFFFFVLLFP